MNDRFIKEELLQNSKAYDLFQAFDEDTGFLKCYYEIKPDYAFFASILKNVDCEFQEKQDNLTIAVTPITYGEYLQDIMQKQKSGKLSEVLLLKWINQLNQLIAESSVINPLLENIFINTKQSQADFSLAAYVQFPVIEQNLKANIELSYETFLTFLSSLKTQAFQAVVPICAHEERSCEKCKLLIALLKLYDEDVSPAKSLSAIYQETKTDPHFAKLIEFAEIPHCEQCCFVEQDVLERPSLNHFQVRLTKEFIFGIEIAQIFTNTQIPDQINKLTVLSIIESFISPDELIPGYAMLDLAIRDFIELYLAPNADIHIIESSECIKQSLSESFSIDDVQVTCEYKSKRSSTMTIVWKINNDFLKQYIVLDDDFNAVIDEFIHQNSGYIKISRSKFLDALTKAGRW